MLRMRGKSWVTDLIDPLVRGEKLGDVDRIFLLAAGTERERRQPIDKYWPGTLGRQNATKVLPIQEQLIPTPVRTDHRSAHIGAKPADVLREGVHDEISTQIQRSLAERCGESVVNDNRHTLIWLPISVLSLDDLCHSRDVNELQRGIHRRLKIDDLGIW